MTTLTNIEVMAIGNYNSIPQILDSFVYIKASNIYRYLF